MKIYVSGSFVSQRRLRKMADELWHLGHTVVGTWLQETAKPVDMPQKTFYKQLGIKDLTEVKEADCIIMDLLDPSSTGGRYCEWGYSFGQQKLRYAVGEVKGVFDVLADEIFATWDDLFLFFKKNHSVKPYVVTTLTGQEVKQVEPAPKKKVLNI